MPEVAPGRTLPKARRPWRRFLRALHRDVGYFIVGLTFIYALSGLAVNHIGEWDPNFVQVEKVRELGRPLKGTDEEIAALALRTLEIAGAPDEVYRASPEQIEIYFEEFTVHVDTAKGAIYREGQEPRFFLRVANWLHLNRGKAAWTAIADAYAVLLLFLATSGLFMLAGRKGLLGRGGVLLVLGILVPVLYVVLSGGP